MKKCIIFVISTYCVCVMLLDWYFVIMEFDLNTYLPFILQRLMCKVVCVHYLSIII